jgi:hypothetical protein
MMILEIWIPAVLFSRAHPFQENFDGSGVTHSTGAPQMISILETFKRLRIGNFLRRLRKGLHSYRRASMGSIRAALRAG